MTITIREGGYYWRRDGVREGPIKRRPGRDVFILFASNSEHIWTSEGYYYSNKSPSQYDLIAEASAGDGWVFWRGGTCPVGADTLVDYQVRGGQQARCAARQIRWDHCGCDGDIIAYRVIEPAPAEPPCDGKPGGEWMAQQLVEKDARIKELEAELAARGAIIVDLNRKAARQQARVESLTYKYSYLREQVRAATPPAEQPERTVETFQQWRARNARCGVVVRLENGQPHYMPTADDISDYLEQRLGWEGE